MEDENRNVSREERCRGRRRTLCSTGDGHHPEPHERNKRDETPAKHHAVKYGSYATRVLRSAEASSSAGTGGEKR